MNKFRIPVILRLKIYLGLFLFISLLSSLCFILFYFGGWLLLTIGLIPLVIVLFIKQKPYGILVEKKEHPKLVKLVEDIAKKLNISCPDKILLTPGASISVNGIFKKNLSIGIASLRNLSEVEFKSILAHEFGHFYGKDTIVSGFFWRVHYSLEITSEFGKAWWNEIPTLQCALLGIIVMLFYKSYQFFFSIISYYHYRQLEYRADFVAAEISGHTNFCNGLLNYAIFSKYFNTVAYNNIIKLLQENKTFVNIYEFVHDAYRKEDHEKIKKQALESEKWSLFRTHPTLQSRLNKINPKDNGKSFANATTLFNDFIKLEEEMTKTISQNLYKNIVSDPLYQKALAEKDRCKYCGERYEKSDELLKHEANCKMKIYYI